MAQKRIRNLHDHPLVIEYLKENPQLKKACGWGYKKSGIRAKVNDSFTLFEDGFIRSLFPGYNHGMPYSLVADSKGIYYDSMGESELIHHLNGNKLDSENWVNAIDKDYTINALQRVRQSGVSKYNCHINQNRHFNPGVLVVDQTAGDTAIEHAGLKRNDFDRILISAIDEHPNKPIYVKTHPDHQYRAKHSCFSNFLLESESVKILPHDMPISEVFSFCDIVYVGSSLLGMEALIHNKKVITYGWSFYSGWGLTEDRGSLPKPKRNHNISLERLFEATYIRYTHYFDPETLEPCDIHRIIDHIETQWKHWEVGAGKWISSSFSPWKKQLLPYYLGKHNITIQRSSSELAKKTKVITWGAKPIPKNLQGYLVVRIEDGFIRSRGLGAEFNFPLSWVFDDIGIYFDARSPSKLENILNEHVFTDEEILEAEELIVFLREHKLTKYNLGIHKVSIPKDSQGRKVILIPGQVDSDASIKYGSPKLANNRELLAEVRRQHPDAYICYKPHPDLLKGARKDAPLWDGIENDVDYLIMAGDIISWIQAVDEVHTLTSTVGFEALIHKKPVHTYGLPFYAGWGLTHDWLKCERRTTTRTLLELACATLILYPTYLNPITKEFTTAINAAKILANPEFKYDSRSGLLKAVGKIKSLYYKLMRRF